MTPGTRLRHWASCVCSLQTMERWIDPVIADVQHEYNQTKTSGRRFLVLLVGYLAFWRMLAVHVAAIWLRQTLRPFLLSFTRTVVPAAVTLAVVTAVLIAPPIQAMTQREVLTPWVLVLLVPQSLPFSIPLAILTGVVCALRRRRLTTMIHRTILLVGLAGVATSCGTIVWMVPAANRAFRVTVAGDAVVPGPAEMSPQSLRDQALAMKGQGREEKAGALLFSYHARWAIVGAPLIFALFGLGLTALRLGRMGTFASGVVACVVFVTYFFELDLVRPSMFANEWTAFTLAWLPNVLMVLTSIAFLSTTHLPDPSGSPRLS
jgi:hypothetical protein